MNEDRQILHQEEVQIDDLIQDNRNFNKGTEQGAALMQRSFSEHGAGRSVFIDKNNRLVAGNKAQQGFKAAGYRRVVIVDSDPDTLVAVRRKDIDLDSKEGREMALLDNLTTQVNLSWDKAELEAVQADVEGFELADFELDVENMPQVVGAVGGGNADETEEQAIERKRKEFEEKMQNGELDEDDPEYQEFLKKFEAKKTTDDCYTPEIVYDALCEWVEREYNVSRAKFVRPFYPGGDYQREKYPKDCYVVDNPPFSIMAEIIRFYIERDIKFFLFAPSLTIFSSAAMLCSCICVDANVTYANGANVCSSFVTNMEPSNVRAKSCPELHNILTEANDRNLAQTRKELPVYSYPDNIVTSTMLKYMSHHGVEFIITKDESEPIDQLEAQKELGKAIFGKGLIISDRLAAEKAAAEKAAAEKAAAEKAAATRWELSQRERDIIEQLNKNSNKQDV